MLSSQDSLRLLLVTGLLVIVGITPLLLRSGHVGGWLRTLPRYGWWTGVGCVCLFVTGRRETEWSLAAAQWILVSSLVLLTYLHLGGSSEEDEA